MKKYNQNIERVETWIAGPAVISERFHWQWEFECDTVYVSFSRHELFLKKNNLVYKHRQCWWLRNYCRSWCCRREAEWHELHKFWKMQTKVLNLIKRYMFRVTHTRETKKKTWSNCRILGQYQQKFSNFWILHKHTFLLRVLTNLCSTHDTFC